LVSDQSSSGLRMQDKSLRLAVMICATLVNTQTDTDWRLLTDYTTSSANRLRYIFSHAYVMVTEF